MNEEYLQKIFGALKLDKSMYDAFKTDISSNPEYNQKVFKALKLNDDVYEAFKLDTGLSKPQQTPQEPKGVNTVTENTTSDSDSVSVKFPSLSESKLSNKPTDLKSRLQEKVLSKQDNVPVQKGKFDNLKLNTPEPDPENLLGKLEDKGMSYRNKATKKLTDEYVKAYKDVDKSVEYKITDKQIQREAVKLLKEDQDKKLYEETNMLEQTGLKLKSGTLRALGGLAGIPNYINKTLFTVFASDEDLENINKLSPEAREVVINSTIYGATGNAGGILSAQTQNYFKEKSKEVEQKIVTFNNSIGEDIANFNFAKAFSRIGAEATGTLPMLAQTMIPYVGLASVAASETSNKQEELEDEGFGLGLDTTINSAANGLVIAASEKFTKTLGDKMFKSFTNGNELVQRTILQDLRKIVSDGVKEGATEVGEGTLIKISDALIQGKEDQFNDYWKEMTDVFIVAKAVGSTLSSVPSMVNQAKTLIEEHKTNEIILSKENGFKDLTDVFKGDNSVDRIKVTSFNSTNARLDKALDKKFKAGEITQKEVTDIKTNFLETKEALNKAQKIKLTPESKVKAVDLLREKAVLEKEIKETDKVLAEPKIQRVEEINNDLRELVNQKPIETPVTQETKDPVKEETIEKTEPIAGKKDVVSGVEITYPTTEEETVRQQERTTPEYIDKATQELEVENTEVLAEELKGTYGFLTGENPQNKSLTEQENKALNEKAKAWLIDKGYSPRKVTGKYTRAENSFFVPNITKEDALEFAKEFKQESVAHSEGMLYADGKVNPRVPENDDISFSEYTPESDFVSIIKTEDGLKTISIGYDFDTTIEPQQNEQNKETDTKDTTSDKTGTDTGVDANVSKRKSKPKKATSKETVTKVISKVFGLGKKQSNAVGEVYDRTVGVIAKRAGKTKEEIYKTLEFAKSTLEEINKMSSKYKALFQIVGENANLAENIKNNLGIAREMESTGKDPKTIRLATGWEKGSDGKWRYEILDGELKGKVKRDTDEGYSSNFEANLESVLENEELFKAYPSLRKIKVEFKDGDNEGFFNKLKITVSSNAKNKKSILLHEIQHAIQEIEGFSQGANPENVNVSIGVTLTILKDELETLEKDFKVIKENPSEFSKEYYTKREKPIIELKEKIKRIEKIRNDKSLSDFDLYKSVAGEVEARNVQTRAKLTLEQRKNTTLQETEDIGREEQIILFDSGSISALGSNALFQINAFHGSPYQFDKFTTSKIGTGEGAQAFGWGLYFTDLESIARNYAKNLSDSDNDNFDLGSYFYRKETEYDPDIMETTVTYFKNERQITEEEFFKAKEESPNKKSPNLYKVSLHKGKIPITSANFRVLGNMIIPKKDPNMSQEEYAGKARRGEIKPLKEFNDKEEAEKWLKEEDKKAEYTWLEWDKRPSLDTIEQFIDYVSDNIATSKSAKDNLQSKKEDIFAGRTKIETGESFYKGFAKSVMQVVGKNTDKDISLTLLASGIDGIKYPAESTVRGTTSDTARGFNYVVFDENAVTIEELIKFQKDAVEAKGAMMMAMDGQAVIYALTNPNVSTPLHELAHVYEHYLTDSERKEILKWSGQKEWTTETSEKFARGFEKYLADGKSPIPSLQNIFQQFREWLVEIYNGITGSEIDLELNDTMRGIYDTMLGGKTSFKNIADSIRSLKVNSNLRDAMSKLQSNPVGGLFTTAFDGALETIATSVEISGDIYDAVQKGIEFLKKTDWYRSLSLKARGEAIEMLTKDAVDSYNANLTADQLYEKSVTIAENSRKLSEGKNSVKETIRQKLIDIIDNALDRQGTVKKALRKANMKDVVSFMVANAGASSRAKNISDRIYSKTFEGLTTDEIKRLEEIIQHKRTISISKNREKRGLEQINRQGFVTRQEAEATLKAYKDKLGDKLFNELSERADAYFNEYRELLVDMNREGLISKQFLDDFLDVDYKPTQYVEFLLDMDGNFMESDADKQNSSPLSGEMIKTIKKGSAGYELMDAWGILQQSILTRTKAVFNNRMNTVFVKEFVKQQQRVAELKKKGNLTKEEKLEIKNFEENVEKHVKLDKVIPSSKEGGKPKFMLKDKNTKGFKSLYYYVDGVKNRVMLRQEFFDKFTDTNQQIFSGNVKENIALASGVSTIKTLATGNNPLFFLTNTPRDFAFVLAFSKEYGNNVIVEAVKLIKDMSKGVRDVVKNTKNYQLYLEYGGGMDFLALQGKYRDKGVTKKIVDAMVSQKTQDRVSKNVVKSFLDKFNLASEVGLRLAVFNKSIDNQLKGRDITTLSKQEQDLIYTRAVESARMLTDFNQGGKAVKALDSALPYLNAALQGTRAAAANLKERPVETLGRIAQITLYTVGTTLGAGLGAIALLRGDDEEDKDKTNSDIYFETIEGVSEYDLMNYYIIPLGIKDAKGNWKYARVAKAQALTPFINFAEHTMRTQLSDTWEGNYKGDLSKIMFNTTKANILPTLSPSSIPLVGATQAYSGIDSYTGKDLSFDKGKVPAELEGLNDDRVEPMFKSLGLTVGISPARLQKMVESYMTTPATSIYVGGAYGLGNTMQSVFGDDRFGKKEDWGRNLEPSLRRLVKSTSEYNKVSKMLDRVSKDTYEAYKRHYLLEGDVRKAIKKVKEEGSDLKQTVQTLLNKYPEDATRLESWIRSEFKKEKKPYIVNQLAFERNKEVRAIILLEAFGADLVDDSGKFNKAALDEEEFKLIKMIREANGLDEETFMYYKNLVKNPQP